jgi:hypothetical protein
MAPEIDKQRNQEARVDYYDGSHPPHVGIRTDEKHRREE